MDIARLIEKDLNVSFQEAESLTQQVGIRLPEELRISEDGDSEKDTAMETEIEADMEAGMEMADIVSATAQKEEQIGNQSEKDNKAEAIPNEAEVADLVNRGISDIFNEVRKSLNYFKTQYQKVNYKSIILCGGMTQLPNLGKI